MENPVQEVAVAVTTVTTIVMLYDPVGTQPTGASDPRCTWAFLSGHVNVTFFATTIREGEGPLLKRSTVCRTPWKGTPGLGGLLSL